MAGVRLNTADSRAAIFEECSRVCPATIHNVEIDRL